MLKNIELDTPIENLVKNLRLNIPTRRNQMQISDQYWAGFFDGEGCITPTRYMSKIHNEKFVVAMKVVVVQKETMVLYLLQKRFGGYVRVSPVVTATGFKTSRGQWELGRAEDVVTFLESIKPYVIV